MFKALLSSVGELKDPFFWKIVTVCLLLTSILFAMFFGTLGIIVDSYLADSWFSWIIEWVGGALTLIMAYFLFPLTFPLITAMFLDAIASHVEKKHYREEKDIKLATFKRTIVPTIKFVLLSLTVNIICFPLYFTPVIGIFAYFIINGYLYGREYFQMIGLRYHDEKELKILRKGNKIALWVAGVLIVIGFTTPFVNLCAPIFATIFAVHNYHHMLKKKQAKGLLT
jgi:CysZ protein